MKDPDLPLIAEIDSDRFHVALLDAESDEARDERLTAAGFKVIRFPERRIWHDGRGVVDEWRDARHQLRAEMRSGARSSARDSRGERGLANSSG